MKSDSREPSSAHHPSPLLQGMLLPSLTAAPTSTEAGGSAYDKAMAHFHREEYDAAIAAFQEAYGGRPDPILLFDIAQAARLGKQYDLALEYYERYLKLAPKAPNAAEVRAYHDALQKMKTDQAMVASLPPPSDASTPPSDALPPEEETTRVRVRLPASSEPPATASPATHSGAPHRARVIASQEASRNHHKNPRRRGSGSGRWRVVP